jgi:hypothetical protein
VNRKRPLRTATDLKVFVQSSAARSFILGLQINPRLQTGKSWGRLRKVIDGQGIVAHRQPLRQRWRAKNKLDTVSKLDHLPARHLGKKVSPTEVVTLLC